MPDYISRQKAIEAIMDLPNCPNGYSDTYDKECIIGTLEEVPTADVVEVVRCKDCKWFNDFGCAIWIVDESDKPKENDFCSFGERRNDGEDGTDAG